MKRLRRGAVLALCLGIVITLAVRSVATAQADNLIVPGERVGPIRLGMYREDVLKAFGQPSKTHTGQPSFWDTYERRKHHWLDIWYGETGDTPYRVVSIDVHNLDEYGTGNGVRTGSSVQDVLREYGSADTQDCTGSHYCMLRYKGIIFVYDPQDNGIYKIEVFRQPEK